MTGVVVVSSAIVVLSVLFHDVVSDEPSAVDVNAVAECGQSGSVHSRPQALQLGVPIIHPTNEGFRRRPVDGFPALDGGEVVAPFDCDPPG